MFSAQKRTCADGFALHRFRLCASTTPPHPPLLLQGAGTSTADYELLAEYLDAIQQLTSAVYDDKRTKADLARLSDRVLASQRVRGGRGEWQGVRRGGGWENCMFGLKKHLFTPLLACLPACPPAASEDGAGAA